MPASYLPPRSSRVVPTTTLGLDLTELGVGESGEFFADLPVATADLPRLASYTRAAHNGGVDFVALGAGFRSRSDEAARPEAWLDPVVTARRLGTHTGAAVVAAVPASSSLAPVVDAHLRVAGGTRTGLQVGDDGDAHDVVRTVGEVRDSFSTARIAPPGIILAADDAPAIEAAAGLADAVRIRESNLVWARELRYAARAAARAAGREDVRVLVDLHIVVAADRVTADGRAELVADIQGPNSSRARALRAVGTARDVAELIDTWVGAGAADGFVILPGSLPADVQALLRDVVPELRRRGLLSANRFPDPPPRTPPETRPRPAAYRNLAVPVA